MATRSVLRPAWPRGGYTPQFRVLIDGREVTRQRKSQDKEATIALGDVVDLSVTLDLREPAQFSLTLANWDAETLELRYGDQFKLQMPVAIDLGYVEDDLVRVFNGKIESLNPNFPDGGAPTITIRGQDLKRDLARAKPKDGEKIRFEKATDVEVAR